MSDYDRGVRDGLLRAVVALDRAIDDPMCANDVALIGVRGRLRALAEAPAPAPCDIEFHPFGLPASTFIGSAKCTLPTGHLGHHRWTAMLGPTETPTTLDEVPIALEEEREEVATLRRQLAESQAREAVLRDLLQALAEYPEHRLSPPCQCSICGAQKLARTALATKPDDAALREFGVRVVERERTRKTCPDCKAMAEELGVLKERLVAQQLQLVRYDAMLQEGKLAELGPLPNIGVAPMTTLLVRASVTNAAMQHALFAEGRAAAQRLIEHASEQMRIALLNDVKPRIRFTEQRQSAFSAATELTAYLVVRAD